MAETKVPFKADRVVIETAVNGWGVRGIQEGDGKKKMWKEEVAFAATEPDMNALVAAWLAGPSGGEKKG